MRLTFYVENDSNDLVVNCLELTAINRTRDMSVANETRVSAFYPYREIEQIVGKNISLMEYCSPRVESITEKEVTVSWNRESYTLCPGDYMESQEYAIDNPYLSWDGMSLQMKYSSINVWDEFFDLCNYIMEDQHHCPARKNKEEKEKCLKLLYEIMLEGEDALRPFYAWLLSCENWDTLIIDDYELFARHLGINNAAQTSYSPAWFSNLVQILNRNRIETMLKAIPSLKAVIESAAKKGIEDAIKIQNGEIEYEHLAERNYPDIKELVLTLKMYDKENDKVNACHFEWITSEQLKSGHKIEMGDFGEVTIVAAEKEKMTLSWLGREFNVKRSYSEYLMDSRVRPTPEEVDNYEIEAWMEEMFYYKPKKYLLYSYNEINIWREALSVIEKIIDPEPEYEDEEEECQPRREQYTKIAKQLLKILIERGDKELEILHEKISTDCKPEEIKELLDLIK